MFKELGQMMGLMKQLPKIKEEMDRLQERLAQVAAEGDAGAGMVKVRVNGKLELSHPENWRKMKASPGKPFCPTCACWVGTLLHEFYHVLHFVEEETKADRCAGQFVTGL